MLEYSPFETCFVLLDLSENLHLLYLFSFEKGFGAKVAAPPEVVEIIKCYNSMPGFSDKRQVLSLIADRYKFSYLKRFNRAYAVTEQDNGDIDVTCPVFWEKPLTKHMYTKAKAHHHQVWFSKTRTLKLLSGLVRLSQF